jgi:hypothetical protein
LLVVGAKLGIILETMDISVDEKSSPAVVQGCL